MAEKITKTLRLIQSLWEAVETEAMANNRSVNRQIETILSERYGLDAPSQGNDLQAVLVDMKRRMDEFEESIRPLIEVVEMKERLNESEPRKSKEKKL